MESFKQGWDKFTPEVAWFLYDFFRFQLDPYDKLLFYGYYIMGFTMEELGERFHCTFQNIAVKLDKINEQLNKCWRHK